MQGSLGVVLGRQHRVRRNRLERSLPASSAESRMAVKGDGVLVPVDRNEARGVAGEILFNATHLSTIA